MKIVGQKIYESNMDKRVTVRLDKKHDDILNQIIKEKKFNNKSEAIRYIIENFKAK